jgi:hypothetical protein
MLEGEQYIINYVTVETLATVSVTNETADASGVIVLTANVTNETANASGAIVFTTSGAIFLTASVTNETANSSGAIAVYCQCH